jgi:hypothetical protein
MIRRHLISANWLEAHRLMEKSPGCRCLTLGRLQIFWDTDMMKEDYLEFFRQNAWILRSPLNISWDGPLEAGCMSCAELISLRN